MFRLSLFRIRAFTFGNLASLLSSLGRGGLMFILIIWLQGIYLPIHGYSFENTPLWAGIAMLPLTIGFLIAGPVSGILSDRFGARPFSTGGMLVAALSFGLLEILPVDFTYWQFAAILLLNGVGMGLFASPNRAGIMNSLPAGQARCRRRDVRDLPELGHGAVDRHLLQPDHPWPVILAARAPLRRPDRPGRVARRRDPPGAPAADRGHVRRAAWLQPDPDAARPGAHQAAGAAAPPT